MPDTERRAKLAARSKATREALADITATLTHPSAKEWAQRRIGYALDDVDGFFLRDPRTRPTSPENETMWLDSAEVTLRLAEDHAALMRKWITERGPGLMLV